MKQKTPTLNDVKEFWENHTCGTIDSIGDKFSKIYFDSIEKQRYKLNGFLYKEAEFDKWKDKKVLEVGIGAGTDFIQFVRNGADATGIDLTQSAVDHVSKRLENEKLSANVLRANAEELPFKDNTFDYIYSHGVLHHTPNTQKAIDEIYRVVKPNGKVNVMLYQFWSWTTLYYFLAVGIKRGQIFKKKFSQIITECTEYGNPDNPITKTFSKKEARKLFSDFKSVQVYGKSSSSGLTGKTGFIFDLLHKAFP